MPSSEAAARFKRKRDVTTTAPNKKSRASPDAEMEDSGAEVLLLEQGILESRKNYNDITKLLGMVSDSEDGELSMLAAVALCRIFVRLLAQGSLTLKKKSSEKEATVVKWLRTQLGEYQSSLVAIMQEDEVTSNHLKLCMTLLKAEGDHYNGVGDYQFPHGFLNNIITTLVTKENEEGIKAYIEEYVEEHDDIRYFTFKGLRTVLGNLADTMSDDEAAQTLIFDQAFTIMSALDGVPESADEIEDFYVTPPPSKKHEIYSVQKHKAQGQKAWLALLQNAKTKDQMKRSLDIMSTVIAPWFSKPEMLADFLTSSYDAGGSMSLLALSGVFYLIKERNLDYPSFYVKLYSLLDRDLLHSKHRSRFLRLMDTFLNSTHLPAALVASFVKRLARLALNAPPSAIVSIVPWMYNILKHHPQCTFMIHREVKDPEIQKQINGEGAKDPFNPDERDPLETRAIDSCLWEVVQLQSHYHPNVATIAKIVSEQFTKQAYNIEDFLDHSYATLLDAEMGKEVKKTPVVEFQIPKRIFMPQDDPAVAPDNFISRLWDFGGPGQQTVA